MRSGIYGGTFNPPHQGHLTSARLAMEALKLDRLLFVPAAVPPHKELPEDSPSAEDRLKMLEIAVDGLLMPGRAEVCDLELHRQGKSYTSDTLEELHKKYPEDELYLLLGTDMFLSLDTWHDPENICGLAHIVAFVRSETDSVKKLELQQEKLQDRYRARAEVVELSQVVPVSSTQIREELKKGEAGTGLPPAVYGYILRRGLYGTHADLKNLTIPQLRACSYSMMKAKRIAHVGGVEEEAVRLARRWGADEELARRAGILHDCTKYYTLDEQLQICDRYGIVLDDLEKISVKLLHSKTGAALARHCFGQPDEVYDAIFWHTTGKPDMNLLEKVVYLADYIEPNRNFEGLEEIRKLSYEDLDAAMQLGLEMSVEDLNERGVPIHKNTQAALDWQKSRRKGS